MSTVVSQSEMGNTAAATVTESANFDTDEAGAMMACLRVMRVAIEIFLKREENIEGLENATVRRTLREFKLIDKDVTNVDADTVFARLEDLLAAYSTQRSRRGAVIRDIARGLSQVFEYDAATQDFLELALHANRCKPLRRVLNLFEEVDEDEAADFFAKVLDYDQETMAETLRRYIPFRKQEPFDIGYCRTSSMFHYLEFNRASVKTLLGRPTLEKMLSVFFHLGETAKLQIEDFHHQGAEIEMLLQYVRQALRSGRIGANVLIYGAPGIGKTELVRAVAAAVQGNLVEVPTVDENKDPLPHWKRLTALTAVQDILRTQATSLVLFDEVEDVFPCETGFSRIGRGGKGADRHKGWLVRMLEENCKPTFWVCNEIAHIDPAYIRRFDFVLELAAPKDEARARIVEKVFAGLPLGEQRLEALKADKDLAPGHLERMGDVLRMLEPSCSTTAETMLNTLERNTRKALNLPNIKPSSSQKLPYRMECINADVDLSMLAESVDELPSARICLYGPPGTGKTEWARQLADRLGRPLHVRRASDLLGKYVGESEKRIRHAFEEATREGAVLLMDEADSLLHDRTKAQRSWEVSMVNEMLTSMESFEGIFIASTNLQESLDEASARRFDFKVKFGCLGKAQVKVLFSDLLKVLEVVPIADEDPGLELLTAVVPGDFVNVFRQARVIRGYRAPSKLMELLGKEQYRRRGRANRRIGFV